MNATMAGALVAAATAMPAVGAPPPPFACELFACATAGGAAACTLDATATTAARLSTCADWSTLPGACGVFCTADCRIVNPPCASDGRAYCNECGLAATVCRGGFAVTGPVAGAVCSLEGGPVLPPRPTREPREDDDNGGDGGGADDDGEEDDSESSDESSVEDEEEEEGGEAEEDEDEEEEEEEDEEADEGEETDEGEKAESGEEEDEGGDEDEDESSDESEVSSSDDDEDSSSDEGEVSSSDDGENSSSDEDSSDDDDDDAVVAPRRPSPPPAAAGEACASAVLLSSTPCAAGLVCVLDDLGFLAADIPDKGTCVAAADAVPVGPCADDLCDVAGAAAVCEFNGRPATCAAFARGEDNGRRPGGEGAACCAGGNCGFVPPPPCAAPLICVVPPPVAAPVAGCGGARVTQPTDLNDRAVDDVIATVMAAEGEDAEETDAEETGEVAQPKLAAATGVAGVAPQFGTCGYNCRSREVFRPAKAAYCCRVEGAPCPPSTAPSTSPSTGPRAPRPAPTLPIQGNCFSREVWSAAKRAYCCEVKGLGCPPPAETAEAKAKAKPNAKAAAASTLPLQRNCFSREVWSAAKRAYCCEVKGLGCPPPAATAEAEAEAEATPKAKAAAASVSPTPRASSRPTVTPAVAAAAAHPSGSPCA